MGHLYLQAGWGLMAAALMPPLSHSRACSPAAPWAPQSRWPQPCEPALHYKKVGAAQIQTPLWGGCSGGEAGGVSLICVFCSLWLTIFRGAWVESGHGGVTIRPELVTPGAPFLQPCPQAKRKP